METVSKRVLTRAQAEAEGFTIDHTLIGTVIGFKGNEDDPDEVVDIAEEAQQVAVIQPSAPAPIVANPLDLPVALFREGLDRRKANRDALIAWIRESLVEGVDYGRLHVVKDCNAAKKAKETGEPNECKVPGHWSKHIMYQPGAQKVCGMLGVTPRFPGLPDYERAVQDGRKVETIILRCEIVDASGRVVGEGVGARSLQKDYNDFNKALKMSEKSGHIDATLKMCGLSELFTQPGGSDEEEQDDELFGEGDVITLYGIIKGSGLYDTDEKMLRQLGNLARKVGHDSLLKVPRKFFDTLKAALENGIADKKAAHVEEGR